MTKKHDIWKNADGFKNAKLQEKYRCTVLVLNVDKFRAKACAVVCPC